VATEVGQAYVSIIPSLKRFTALLRQELLGELRQLNPAVGQAGGEAGRAFGDGMREGIRGRLASIGAMLKTGLVTAAAAAVAGLGALTAFGLKSAASLEQTQIGLEALIGSAEEAGVFLGELQQFAATTPFEFQGVADAARRVLAFGNAVGIARDEVIPTLTTIGDLVSVLGGTQENIDSVVRALGQISSKGKVSQEELLQLAEALPGFNANAAIASALGVDVATSMEMITAGEVDATTGINALLAGMAQFPGAAGAMEKQAGTLLGVFSTFKDTISIALSDAFQPVIPQIKDALAGLTPVLGDAIGQLAPSLGGLLSSLMPLIGQIATALTPVLTPLLDGLSRAITILSESGALEALGQAFGAVATALAPLLPMLGEVLAQALIALAPVIAELAPVIAELVPPLGELLLALLPAIPALGEWLAALAKLLVPVADLVGWLVELAAKFLIGPLVDKLAEGMEWLADGVSALAGWLSDIDWSEVWNSITSAVSGAWDAIVSFFRDLPGNIATFLSELPGKLREKATEALETMAFWVGFGIGKVVRFFVDLPGNIVEFLRELPGKLREKASEAGESFREKAVEVFNRALDWIKGLPGRIADFIKELPGKIRERFSEIKNDVIQLGKDIVNGVITGIRNTVGGVGSALTSGLRSALDGVKKGLGIASPSKVYMEVGEDTIEGYIVGVQSRARAAADATMSALAPATVGTSTQVAAAPAPVPVVAGDSLIAAALAAIREAIRTQYDGDPNLALTVSI